MEVEMKMPDLSTTEAQVKVIAWLVDPGQPVTRGQPLLEVETDKATMEVEALETGVLKAQQVQPGDDVDVGSPIATIQVEGRATEKTPTVTRERKTVRPSPSEAGPSAASHESAPKPRGMFARNRRAAADAEAATSDTSSRPLSTVQRTIARRMVESKQTIPHYYLQTSANAEPMRARREADRTNKIVWDAFFVCAVGRALVEFDQMACHFEGDRLIRPATDAVGVAMDIEGELLVVPVAGGATKTPAQVSADVRSTVRRIRSGDAETKRIRPASITITNLGVANVESFIPIIVPSETAILGIGKIAPQAVVVEGEIVVQHRVSLTLSVDHRVINGRYAAGFLDRVVRELESPLGDPA